MPKLYYVRDEVGVDGPYYATLKEARDDWDQRISEGLEPEGLHSLTFRMNRRSVADLMNMIRDPGD